MKISIGKETVEVSLSDLKNRTVGELQEKIVEKIGGEPEDIRLFHKTAKLEKDMKLDTLEIDDNTKLFAYVKQVKKPVATGTPQAPPQSNPQPNANVGMNNSFNPQGMGNPYGNAMPGMAPNMGGLTPDMMKSMLNDPNMIEMSINMMMPNASEEEKQALRQQFDMVKNNPEMMNMVLNSFGGNNPMPGMGDMSSMLNNPEVIEKTIDMIMPGASEEARDGMRKQFETMKNNPEMMNMMMNNMGGMPGMGMPPFTPMNNVSTPAPQNGPCSHGFYPMDYIKDIDQKMDQLNAMGFTDKAKNMEALKKAGGSLEGAIEHLTNQK